MYVFANNATKKYLNVTLKKSQRTRKNGHINIHPSFSLHINLQQKILSK